MSIDNDGEGAILALMSPLGVQRTHGWLGSSERIPPGTFLPRNVEDRRRIGPIARQRRVKLGKAHDLVRGNATLACGRTNCACRYP